VNNGGYPSWTDTVCSRYDWSKRLAVPTSALRDIPAHPAVVDAELRCPRAQHFFRLLKAACDKLAVHAFALLHLNQDLKPLTLIERQQRPIGRYGDKFFPKV